MEISLTQIVDVLEATDANKMPVFQAMLAFMRKMVCQFFAAYAMFCKVTMRIFLVGKEVTVLPFKPKSNYTFTIK